MISAAVWAGISLLFVIGLAGTIIPGVPGVGLVFAGVLVYGVVTDFTILSVPTVILFGIVAVLAWLADYAGSAVGSKLGGGNKKALAGTVIGAIVGAFAGPLGIFIGAFLGSLTGVLLEGKNSHQAAKVAFYSVLGTLGATVIQFILALAMIIAFLVIVF
ncbi:MAG: DUF456 domain-containing protein [Candidatus Andersenbacteria bacterium]